MPNTLRVRTHGTAMVPDFERLEAGTNAFIGRKYTEISPGKRAFVPSNEVIEVPYRAEYLKALKDGDLLPGDDATAEFAGLKTQAPTEPASDRDGGAS